MIAALISDLDSIFNSASNIFTLDIYKTVRQKASQRELLVMGRLFVVFMVIISIAWVPVIIEMQGGQTYLYIQAVSGYLSLPVAALFLLGVFWKRCNEKGAFWGGVTGFTLGTLRLILAFIYHRPRCDQQDNRPAFIAHVHFMYAAASLFWISGLVAMAISLCTSPPDHEQIRTITVWGLRNIEKVPVNDREETYRLTEKSLGNGDGSVRKEMTPNVLNTKCLDGANVKLLVPSTDHEPAMPSTETSPASTPADRGGRGQVEMSRTEEGYHANGDISTCMRVLDWFCGYKEATQNTHQKVVKDEPRAIAEMLYEPPRVKLLLNMGLFCGHLYVCLFFTVTESCTELKRIVVGDEGENCFGFRAVTNS
ncbi:hypothetical protein LDENG_00260220 [Lucifuga dentata]|nr:hypothetical protein LDENG_00260220 [Lucifuga dentata]